MVFSVFGADRIARFNIQVGQEVMVSFDIDAHEYQGRWFNSIRAYDVRQVDPAQFGAAAAAPQAAPAGSRLNSLQLLLLLTSPLLTKLLRKTLQTTCRSNERAT